MNTFNLDFLKNASGVGYGPGFSNDRYSLAVVQISGTFTLLSMVLEGRTDVPDGEWETVAGWSVSTPDTKAETVSGEGIYEYPIEGIREFRFRILSIEGGTVSASGVLYDAADGSVFPRGQAPGSVTFGDPALFVKGVAEQIFFDPSNGNIVGYDKTATEGSVSVTANLSEITGGMGNRLIGVLPDTARISGTYTSAAFSLETRERIMGGQIAYNAVSTVCETITADSMVLRVSRPPAPSLAEDPNDTTYWCYIRYIGGDVPGEWREMRVNPRTRTVVRFIVEPGDRFEVIYYTHNASAQMLPVPTIWNPVIMTVQVRYGVYARQNGSAERGILKGWLFFIVPRAILNADAGVNTSQTANANTGGGWIALPEKPENMPMCGCGDNAHPLAYYVYAPCSGINDAVSQAVSVGSGLTLKAGRSAQLPIKFVMPDDSLIQPDFSALNYVSSDDSVATVDNGGVVKGISAGEAVIRAMAYRSDGSSISCETVVAVDGSASPPASRPKNIIWG